MVVPILYHLLSDALFHRVFICLEWIEMVEKLVGEVDRRSYKDGSQAQLGLVIKDKGATNPSFEKLRENLSFSIFTKGTTYYSP